MEDWFPTMDDEGEEYCSSVTMSLRFPNTEGLFLMPLTKEKLLEVVATLNGYQKNRATKIVETLIGPIESRLASGEDVLISGFGKFCVKRKHERKGRD
jgi:hypothetical protein